MSDIRALELEFAKTPTLDTCIPLCEAYLDSQRFMEAMVVCKKGIKSAPDDPRGRVLLSRVYLDQGKLPKAQAELEAVLAEHPNNASVLEIQGRIAMRVGNAPVAVQALQQALMINPNLTNARAWLLELGVQPPVGPAGAAPGHMAAPMQMPMAHPGQVPVAHQPIAQPMSPSPMVPAQGQVPPHLPPQMPPQVSPQMPPQMPGHAAGQAMPMAGGVPGQMPPQMPPPGAGPTNPFEAANAFMGAAGAAPGADPSYGTPFAQAPQASAPPPTPQLEHVSDFFSTETLGFSDSAGGPETAGPGRLTIIGFVPKSTGSIKTTIIVALGVIAVAASVLTYVWISSNNKRAINAKYSQVLELMSQDKYVDYKATLALGDEILAIDSDQDLTLSTLAYAHAVLAHEHGEDESLGKAKEYLKRAVASSAEQNEWKVIAAALIAYHEGNYDEGIAGIKGVAEKSSRPLVQMEYYRLLNAKDPAGEETDKAFKRTKAAVVGEARVLSFIGWQSYMNEAFNDADKNFTSALQNVKSHELALIGSALADLERGVGLKERQKEIEKNLKKIFSLPSEELSQPVRAMAHFARSQLRNWQGQTEEAQADYTKALKLDPKNPIFPYRRGVGEMSLGNHAEAVNYLKQAVKLQPNRTAFLTKLVQAQIVAKDYTGAEATLKRALELSAGNWELIKAKGDLARAKGDHAGALKAYGEIDLDKHGGRAVTMSNVGIAAVYRDSNRAGTAVKHLEDFLKKAPKSVSADPRLQAQLWEALGLSHEAAGNKAKAEEAFRVGTEQFRYHAPNHYHICRLMKFKGPEAREFCKVYLSLEPRGEFAAEIGRKGIKGD